MTSRLTSFLLAPFQSSQLAQHFPRLQATRTEMVAEYVGQRQAQAGQVVGIRLLVSGQRQQRATRSGRAAFVASAITQQATRTVFRIQQVACSRIDGETVAVFGQIEARSQGFQQVAFEAAQGPRKRITLAESCARFAVDVVEVGCGSSRWVMRKTSSLR